MAKRIQKKDVVERLASRLSVDEEQSEEYLDAVLETLYEAFKSGVGVSLPNFGSFYLDRRRSGCVFKFNPSQKLKALFGWSSTYKKKGSSPLLTCFAVDDSKETLWPVPFA